MSASASVSVRMEKSAGECRDSTYTTASGGSGATNMSIKTCKVAAVHL